MWPELRNTEDSEVEVQQVHVPRPKVGGEPKVPVRLWLWLLNLTLNIVVGSILYTLSGPISRISLSVFFCVSPISVLISVFSLPPPFSHFHNGSPR